MFSPHFRIVTHSPEMIGTGNMSILLRFEICLIIISLELHFKLTEL
jgi:hypothetical protein